MIDHIGVEVGDLASSKTFYDAALEPLGITALFEFGGSAVGYGSDLGRGPKPYFWVHQRGRDPVSGAHVAFRAGSRELVDAFYEAAMAAGGADNGAPGLRPDYHPNYYGAFVFDPDGNNIEAVCHRAPAEA